LINFIALLYNMLLLVVLIQTLFFIVNDAHFYVILFILFSFSLSKFSKNELIYLLLPVIIVHVLYLHLKEAKEGFIKLKKGKKMISKTSKSASNGMKKAVKDAEDRVRKEVGNRYDGILRTVREEAQRALNKVKEEAEKRFKQAMDQANQIQKKMKEQYKQLREKAEFMLRRIKERMKNNKEDYDNVQKTNFHTMEKSLVTPEYDESVNTEDQKNLDTDIPDPESFKHEKSMGYGGGEDKSSMKKPDVKVGFN
jgi:ElaB/YqjD/DUF883 family membrane-anchored ribosome-binding protein